MSDSFEQKEKSFLSYFIKNPKVAYVLGILIIVWGLLTTAIIPKESAPFIEFGIVNISTIYDGASAADIDELVTQKVENKIKSINGINKITSNSRIGISSVTVEFEPDHDMIRGVSDLRSKIDEVKGELPAEIDKDPILTEISSSTQPFISVLLHGDQSQVELRDHAEELKKQIEKISGVSEVNIAGGREREISVEIDPLLLHSYNLNINDVANTISSSHRNLPLGDIDIENLNYTIRFEGQHKTSEDIQNLYIANNGGTSLIQIKDIAKVHETGKDSDNIERLTIPGKETKNFVELTAEKGLRTNIFKIDSEIRETAKIYTEENKDLEVNYAREMAPMMLDDFMVLFKSGGSSILIVLLLIFIFVGFKEGLIASLVIPLTFLTTIGVSGLTDGTLNFMSNFSMILALGILVDTAIVVVEGCHDYIRKGRTPYEAAILSLHEYKGPLISGTLTTLAVFIPLFTLPGMLGKYLTFIPITVSIVLSSALVISLLIITAYASRFLKAERPDEEKTGLKLLAQKMRDFFNAKQKASIDWYYKMVNKIVRSRFWRIGIIYIILVLFALSWLIPIKFDLFPQGDAPFISVRLEQAIGTTSEKTVQKALDVEEIMIKQPEIEILTTEVNGNIARLSAELLPIDEREDKDMRDSIQLVFDLQEEFKKIPHSQIQVQNAQQGPPSASPVAFRIIASDTNKLDEAEKTAKELKEMLKGIPGTFGVSDDIDITPGEIKYTIDRDKALALGINPDLVASTLRTAISGRKTATITRNGVDIDINVKYAEDSTNTLNKLANIYLTDRENNLVNIEELVNQEITAGLNSINRSDTDISFTISSFLTEDGNAAEITNTFLEKVKSYELPAGVKIATAGENEENVELFQALGSAFLIAIMIMFLILLIQFKSYLQPLIILSTIIFAMIGVNVGLYLTDTPRSLPFILGTIALAGIVVNDAIILIDQINRKRREGLEEFDAITRGGRSRFTPIVLTTLTTAAGIAPLIVVDNFWAGLSYTVIFGLIVASFLTLVVTPAMYYQLEHEKIITFLPIAVLIFLLMGISNLFSAELMKGIIMILIAVLFLYLIKRSWQRLKLEN